MGWSTGQGNRLGPCFLNSPHPGPPPGQLLILSRPKELPPPQRPAFSSSRGTRDLFAAANLFVLAAATFVRCGRSCCCFTEGCCGKRSLLRRDDEQSLPRRRGPSTRPSASLRKRGRERSRSRRRWLPWTISNRNEAEMHDRRDRTGLTAESNQTRLLWIDRDVRRWSERRSDSERCTR